MKIIENPDSFGQIIAENNFVMAVFSGQNCSVCHAVIPKLQKLVTDYFSDILLVEILVEQLPELAARYSVFTIPVILFWVDGREYIREARYIDLSILKQNLEKIFSLYK